MALEAKGSNPFIHPEIYVRRGIPYLTFILYGRDDLEDPGSGDFVQAGRVLIS